MVGNNEYHCGGKPAILYVPPALRRDGLKQFVRQV